MKQQKNLTDEQVSRWVNYFLGKPELFLSVPLSNDKHSPWKVNIHTTFLSNEAGITLSEANGRRALTLPILEKMSESKIVIKEVSSRENTYRQKILFWYSMLSLEEKMQLPRTVSNKNNICFKSLGEEQKSWDSLALQYEWIGKTVDEIHEALHKIGIIDAGFKTFGGRKKKVIDAETIISQWVSKMLNDENALWDLPVSLAENSLEVYVSASYIQSVLGMSYSIACKHRTLTAPLVEAMVKNKILVDSKNPEDLAGLDLRRQLLRWYRHLSKVEKLALPIFGNIVSLNKMPAEKRPIRASAIKYNSVKSAWSLIHEDLAKLGVINTNYKSVAEKVNLSKAAQKSKGETLEERFGRLEKTRLEKVTDFINPSPQEPFIQVEQLFALQRKTIASKSGKNNYVTSCNYFIKYLIEFYGTSPLIIVATFDEHILARFRKYLQQEIISKNVSNSHANTVLSNTRKTLRRLLQVNHSGFSFYGISGFDHHRVTDAKRPFTNNERLQILNAIDNGISKSKDILTPYQKINIGQNPLDSKGGRIRGLSNLDNARWLFENKLNCTPVYYTTKKSAEEKAFLQIILESDKGLSQVYDEWSVPTMLGVDNLIPHLLRLAQITGMNPEPLLSLDIGDYVDSHPATLRPCLRYWKERSDGHKEYHLDLMNSQLTWLSSSQAKSVKQVFKDVINLTSSLRKDIQNTEFKNRLFVYQSMSTRNHGKVAPILGEKGKNLKSLGDALTRFVSKYDLKNEEGAPLTMTISRFRPTFVSDMLNNGVPLREIQLMLGHASIQTTINYLDSLDFNNISRKKLNDKLKEIHQSTTALTNISSKEQSNLKDSDEVNIIFQTPLAGCKNIFSPPDFIKKLPSYTPGSPCSQYNKCLGCDNVIITASNLPEIFAMDRDYKHLVSHTRVMDTPYGHVVRENIELIKGIIDPELSDFSKMELESGLRLAEYIDATVLVDGVI
ncbi:site-specific integrase [Pseudoalteromonas agarivorans]|uniref:Uncharacterized protein n=1 Tax=Pseudoalteromonas agarivorans DSM 14585 TaxID=1312369 RepID=A0ACA8DTP7_9GAMM|nr:site-specific integrase [Pseudoalteromonas agarivorans]ATC81445.1 hypothetical protein PAGA_a0964 [Pseudoalteromonas agarivorans DSM 14585]